MAFASNRPNRLNLDSFSDTSLDTSNGSYSAFSNRLTTPILNAKGLQLLSASFINSALQLNDQGQLMFFYYYSTTQAGIATAANLRCVRLLPSNYVPYTGFTAYTQNQYFNTVSDLVAQLNVAASTGGDSATYNPYWVANGVTFTYNASTRKISVAANNATYYIAPAAFDDPNVQSVLTGKTTGGFSGYIKMNTYNSSNTYASAVIQPVSLGITMNSRLGFTLSYNGRGTWWNSTSQVGCATSTGVPQLYGTPIVADANPILLGSQNLNVYLDIVVGGGNDSLTNKNLLASIPISAPALNVVAFTASGAREPIISVPQEIYSITVTLLDENGLPFVMPVNYNLELSVAITY